VPGPSARKVVVGIVIALCLSFAFWPFGGGSSPQDSDIVAITFSADGQTLLAGARSGEVFALHVGDGRILGSGRIWKSRYDHRPAGFNSLAFERNGRFVVWAGTTLKLIAFDSVEPLPVIDAPRLAFGGAAISPDGRRVSAISSAERLLVWKLEGPSRPIDLGRADAGVYGATAFSPDGTRIALAGHTLRMFYAQSGTEVWSKRRDNYASLCVAFCPDGRVLASGSQDSSIRLWSADTGDEVSVLRGHQGYVDAVSFSPDGKKIASWARSGQLFLWDLVTPVAIPTNLAATTGGASFSPDGRWIASGEARKTVGLWDTQTGKKIRDLSIR